MDERQKAITLRRMTAQRAVLLKESPFFGRLVMRLTLACAPCGTACTDGSRLIFDPAFAARLGDGDLRFVMLHEVLHCVLNHCVRGKGLVNGLYNLACDAVVNSIILQMWGLTSFPVDGGEPLHQAPDGREGYCCTAEEIYEMLLKRGGAPPGWEGLPGPGGSGGDGVPGVIDRHDIWGGIENPSLLRDAWNGYIRQAAAECGGSGGLPQSLRPMVEGLTRRAQVDWRQVLHDFIQRDEFDYFFCPPDRRFSGGDLLLPAYSEDEDSGAARGLWVCVDASGSISDEALTRVMLEVEDAMAQAGLTGMISFFDSGITEPKEFTSVEELRDIPPSGGGGTSFHVIFRYLRDRLMDAPPRAVLIFTDGYAACPPEADAMGVPVLWLVQENGKADMPWGLVIQLDL